VGLDTSVDYIPPDELKNLSPSAAVLKYNKAIIDVTLDVAACYKVQIAYYEALGLEGLAVYSQTLKYIKAKGGISIADIKRGDIADTAAQYAKAHFSGDFEADFVTLNPYMGMDSIEPWLKNNKGAFVLLRTSNKGFKDFEGRQLKDGSFVYDAVGEKLLELAKNNKCDCGYGAFGAVVGAETKTEAERMEALALREKYSKLFFLIPGYGAQGGGAAEAALLLTKDKNGGVVNASRSILKAWCNKEKTTTIENAAVHACTAAIEMRDAIRNA
jgi:orotidine-5'-phosphate decarboxylase